MRTTFRALLQGDVQFTTCSASESESAGGEGRVRNLSTSGVCIITQDRLDPGDLLELTILSYGEKMDFRGEVVHIEDTGEGFVVGVRFDIDHPATEESLWMLASLGAE